VIYCLPVVVMPEIPGLQRLKQEDQEFKASLGHIGRPCLKNKAKQNKTENETILLSGRDLL
jgi:hypothetical protein